MPTEPEPIPGGTRERLARSPFFALERLTLDGPSSVGDPDRFTILLGVEGEAEVRSGGMTTTIGLGRTLLLPASVGPCEVIPRGPATLLTCVVP